MIASRSPSFPVDGKSHSSVLSDPDPAMVDLIVDFLRTGDVDEKGKVISETFDDWSAPVRHYGDIGKPKMRTNPAAGTSASAREAQKLFGHLFGKNPDQPLEGWQQFVVHAIDERRSGPPLP